MSAMKGTSMAQTRRDLLLTRYIGQDTKKDFPALMARYDQYSAKEKSVRNHWAVKPSLYTLLRGIFDLDREYFASPLNFHPAFEYCSKYEGDKVFGSLGSAYAVKWDVNGVLNPEYDDNDYRDKKGMMLDTVTRVVAAMEEARKENRVLTLCLVLPGWHNFPYYKKLVETATSIFSFEAKSFAFESTKSVVGHKGGFMTAPWEVSIAI